eukprot:SAG31_NODE_330_length_17593_cov_4.817891_19_plen_81_part_00
MQQGRLQEAQQALLTLRDFSEPQARAELHEIEIDVEQERQNPTANCADFMSGITLRRVITGMGLQMFQMLTGQKFVSITI